MESVIIELTITLETLDFTFKFVFNISIEMQKFEELVRFRTKMVNPLVRKMVKKKNKILKTTRTNNRKSLEIRVNNIKTMFNIKIRTMKRKFHMFAKLARMTDMWRLLLLYEIN